MSIRCRILLLALYSIAVTGCYRSGHETKSTGNLGGSIRYANRFTLEKKDGIEILTIKNPWQGASGISQTWILAARGQLIPAGYDTSHIIRVPLKSVVAMSTTFLSMIDTIGESDKIAGISGASLLYNSNLREKVMEGKIADVGYDDNINRELIVKIRPDVVIVYGIGGESSGSTGKLRDMGIKVLFNADYLENDPLGKAEWIKVFGALFSKEKQADDIFSGIVTQYDSIKSAVAGRSDRRPSVLLGLPWKDSWFISPGNSFICRLISDAGGEYIWKDTFSETSMPYGIESVWVKALKADYWFLNSAVTDSKAVVAIDSRLADLPVFKSGNMYNNDKRVSETGGNDYWESGSIKPQVILRDLAAILHPELFPEYSFCYFRKVK